ncbi:MAG: hypothetical protein AABY32_01680 [Nanoarchaeota archaeon]
MGYCVTCDCNVTINSDNIKNVLSIINKTNGGFYRDDNEPFTSIIKAFSVWGYLADIDENMNIIINERNAEKWIDDDKLWTAIAKFVTPNSYLIFIGEDGYQWKYQFENGEMVEYNKPDIWIKKK